jgi:hypothetical protein
MRVLILSPRLPARGGKGDQGRTFHVVEALRPEHEVTVLTGGLGPGDVATLERLARVEVVREGLLARALGALLSLLRGRPGQIGWMTPPHWRPTW